MISLVMRHLIRVPAATDLADLISAVQILVIFSAISLVISSEEEERHVITAVLQKEAISVPV